MYDSTADTLNPSVPNMPAARGDNFVLPSPMTRNMSIGTRMIYTENPIRLIFQFVYVTNVYVAGQAIDVYHYGNGHRCLCSRYGYTE